MRLVSYILGGNNSRTKDRWYTPYACNFPLIRRIERVNLWVSANGCNSLLCHIPWVSSVWKYSEVKSHSTSFPFVWPRVPYSPFFFLGTLVLDHLPKVSHATRWTSHAGLLCARPMPQKYVYMCGNVPVLPLLILYKYWNEKRKGKSNLKWNRNQEKL